MLRMCSRLFAVVGKVAFVPCSQTQQHLPAGALRVLAAVRPYAVCHQQIQHSSCLSVGAASAAATEALAAADHQCQQLTHDGQPNTPENSHIAGAKQKPGPRAGRGSAAAQLSDLVEGDSISDGNGSINSSIGKTPGSSSNATDHPASNSVDHQVDAHGSSSNTTASTSAGSSTTGSSFTGSSSSSNVMEVTPVEGSPGSVSAAPSKRPSRPRPRSRQSTSVSKQAIDEGQQQQQPSKRKYKSKAADAQGNSTAPAAQRMTPPAAQKGLQHSGPPDPEETASASASATKSSTSSRAQPAAVAVAPAPDMALRNAFNPRNASAALVGPSQPVSPAALRWCSQLGIAAATLHHWQAGMTVLPHPNTQQQVEVLALPYLRNGRLVDVRYLELSVDGQRCVSSWLAKGGSHLFMKEQDLQSAVRVVFVSSELEALALSSAGLPAIAVARQAPSWKDQHSPQQHQAHQHIEDPRLRLTGLAAELSQLQQQQNLKGGSNTTSGGSGGDSSSGSSGISNAGLVVSNVSSTPQTGLALLVPSARLAVIAMEQGPEGQAVGGELAQLLGEVACRHMLWPGVTPGQAAAAAAAGAVLGSADPLEGETGTSSIYTAAAAAAAEELLHGLQQALNAPDVMSWTCVLVNALLGPQQLLSCIDEAYVWPIAGLERFSEHTAELLTYFKTPDMGKLALPTGWSSLDHYYKVAPGEVTLVTGVPNSGKSEWLDALAVNLALDQGWRFAVCSMEKRPRDHARQLLEKIAGKPMLCAAYGEGVPRMTAGELEVAYRTLREHFFVIASGEDSMPGIAWVLEKAKAAVILYGINGLIIDPYNELDPTRGPHLKEHEHVNELMGLLRKFARDNKVHCWLVAHPRQMSSLWQGQRPGLQDISGGANFMNKTDNGIIVHREWSRMKELQQRQAAAAAGVGRQGRAQAGAGEVLVTAGSASSSSSSNRRRRSSSASATEKVDEADEADSRQPDTVNHAAYEVHIIVEKVRNKTTGCKGECMLLYDRVTGRYREVGQEPVRGFQGAVQCSEAAVLLEEQDAASELLLAEYNSSARHGDVPAGVDGAAAVEQTEEEVLAASKELVSES